MSACAAAPVTAAHPAPPPDGADTSALLPLLWLASPALPIGGFSYSDGLESSVERSFVASESEATAWLVEQLHLVQACADLAVVAQAVTAWRDGDLARVRALNAWVLRTRETSELRLQAEQMGRSLLEWLRNQDAHAPDPAPARHSQTQALAAMDPSYPVAFALAASRSAASVRDIVTACAFAWAENMVQAALKAVPLGQNAGQRMLARLVQDIPAAVTTALATDDDARQSFAPMLAILSAQHETQYSRLFRS